MVKLLDYTGKEEELEGNANPFALLVLTHLQARATRNDPEGRARWKERLLLGLYNRGLDAEDVRQWYRFIDWLLDLPQELERRVWEAVAKFEEEHQMPFVSSPERHGFQRGFEKGLVEGEQKGLQEALQESLFHGIALSLELKFGEDGLALLPAIRQQTDAERLQRILEALRTAASIEEVRELLPPCSPKGNGESAPGKDG